MPGDLNPPPRSSPHHAKDQLCMEPSPPLSETNPATSPYYTLNPSTPPFPQKIPPIDSQLLFLHSLLNSSPPISPHTPFANHPWFNTPQLFETCFKLLHTSFIFNSNFLNNPPSLNHTQLENLHQFSLNPSLPRSRPSHIFINLTSPTHLVSYLTSLIPTMTHSIPGHQHQPNSLMRIVCLSQESFPLSLTPLAPHISLCSLPLPPYSVTYFSKLPFCPISATYPSTHPDPLHLHILDTNLAHPYSLHTLITSLNISSSPASITPKTPAHPHLTTPWTLSPRPHHSLFRPLHFLYHTARPSLYSPSPEPTPTLVHSWEYQALLLGLPIKRLTTFFQACRLTQINSDTDLTPFYTTIRTTASNILLSIASHTLRHHKPA